MTQDKSFQRWMLLAFGVVTLVVLASGTWFSWFQWQHMRQNAELALESVAQLKVNQIATWRADQLRNASMLMDSPFFHRAVARWLASQREEDARELVSQFRSLQTHYHYIDVLLVDASSQVRLSLSGSLNSLHPLAVSALSEAWRERRPALSDLHAGPGSLPPHIGVAAPLFAPDAQSPELIGTVILQVDARQFLFPMVQSWPVPSASAETLLVRRDSGTVLYLNDLRHRAGTALVLRMPLDREEVPAVQAVLGREACVLGIDYRGVEVLSALKPVPDSPWYMVAKVDAEEIFAEWRHRFIFTALLVGLFISFGAAAALAVLRRHSQRYDQALMQAHSTLQDSQSSFRGLFDNAINGVAIHEIVLDDHGRPVDYIFTEANAAFAAHTGLRVADVLGKRATHVLPGIERSRFIDIYGQTALTGKSVAFEEYSEQLGRHFSISAFQVGHGRFATVFQDTTERNRALAALQESESRLRALADSAQDAILMMDPDGRICFWNQSAERILGYNRADALGRDLHALIAPQRFQDGFRAAFPEFRRTGRGAAVGKTVELQACHADGHEISVDLSLSAFQSAGAWHAVGILRDTTARKQAEEALRQANTELEQATLHANELAVHAELANAAKSEFLANMSHEIRTPMNGVIGMTNLLLDTELSPEQRRYAEIVHSSGESLLAIINDILDFSKIEARKLELETLDFDLRVTIEDATEILANRAHAKGLELVCLIAPEVPSALRGDPGRLRQVVVNMAGNAIKFTQQGEVALRVQLVAEDVNYVTLRFDITDTGIGIPESKIPMLFSAFTQVDGSTTRKFGGTGLGLAISKQLAELMGGQVGVTSTEGSGSTFWFTAVFEKMALIRPVPDDRGDLRGVKVLIVDDNETNRLLLAALLTSWGCRSEEAADAGQALEALEGAAGSGDPFEIAILDMLMPSIDGAQLGRAIKDRPAIRATRLVMMTSLGERGQAARLTEIGFSGYLTKPIRQSQLRECLALVLGRVSRPDSAPREAIVTRHTVAESRKRRIRILLAEDNPTNQVVALEILKKLGYGADVVASGKEAVHAWRSAPYDLVLMDCQMPEMDGFEATRRIRQAEPGDGSSGIPIVAMTANAMKGDRERCLEAGMNDYLCKPVQPAELAVMLERWLQRVADKPAAWPVSEPAGAPNASAAGLPEKAGPSPAGASDDLIMDWEGFMSRLMGDFELAGVIVKTFLSDMPLQIEKLAAAVAGDDSRQSERYAHRIKGASANLGSSALVRAAEAMELAGRADDIPRLRNLMPVMSEQFEVLRRSLEEAQLEPHHTNEACSHENTDRRR